MGTIWSVSPDGSLVAYVEATSGRIHVIRADRLDDVAFSSFSAICTTTASCATPPFLSWSPDGEHIAYQSEDGSLHLVNADGTGDQTIVASEHGDPTALVWSSDSQMLAFVELDGEAESIWAYDLPNNVARQVAASADPSDSAASVDQMFWLQGSGQPTLTWTAWEPSARSLTGIFSCPVLQSSCVQNLTPANITLTAAGFTPQESNGTWLVGFTNRTGTPEIATIAVSEPELAISNAQLQNTITGVYWSPLGETAALVDSTGQMLLATNNGASLFQLLTYDVTGTPVWSPDGTHLATPVQDLGIMSINFANGNITGFGSITSFPRLLPSVPTLAAATMLWSTDGQYLAITSQSGTYLVSSDGKSVKQIDTQTASGPFGWSLSG